jgi:hypothetical protein
MNQAQSINTPAVKTHKTAIAACMDELAIQMIESADVLRTSAMTGVTGNSIAMTVSGMKDRAHQIKGMTAGFRLSGDMAAFDAACQLAGWHPDPKALETLHGAH